MGGEILEIISIYTISIYTTFKNFVIKERRGKMDLFSKPHCHQSSDLDQLKFTLETEV